MKHTSNILNSKHQIRVIPEVKPKNWTKHTRGLGKDVWKDVDIDQYIKDLRDEWSKQN